MAAPVVFGLPLYMAAITLKILDTYLIMIIAYLLMNLGFAVWILKGFFDGIPRDLDETAFLQGTRKVKSFWYIDLPLAKKGVAVAGIFTFMFTWNDSFYATLLGGSNIKTISALLPSYFIHHIPQWSTLSAAGTIYIIPSVIFAIVIFQLIQHGLRLKI
jgi:multiple sugar transport system permease protein